MRPRLTISAALILTFALIQPRLGLPALGTPAAAQSTADLLAAQVRSQGYPCDRALHARRNKKLSRPDLSDWTLTCNNAVYRMRLDPDIAARITKIK
jgi:hypothetical protein